MVLFYENPSPKLLNKKEKSFVMWKRSNKRVKKQDADMFEL